MQTLTLMELSNMDFSIRNISALYWAWSDGDVTSYTSSGRVKNLLYYMIKGHREYSTDDNLILHLYDSDIIFIPDGYCYLSKVTLTKENEKSTGIGIAFDLYDQNGEQIRINEPLKIVATDSDGSYLDLFNNVLEAVTRPTVIKIRAKANLYVFFNKIASTMLKTEYLLTHFNDIFPAIEQIEKCPEINVSISELAQLCHMSESSFRRKFKQYSNGISPLAYRNRIRIMKAEELCTNTSYTIEMAAQLLGFCDAAHLCRMYNQYTGKTLKRKCQRMHTYPN
jgi:AraC-like DNA-binding protein